MAMGLNRGVLCSPKPGKGFGDGPFAQSHLVSLQKKPLWCQIWSFDNLFFMGSGKALCSWIWFPVRFITSFERKLMFY